MSVSKDTPQNQEELMKSLEGLFTQEELEDLFKSEDAEGEEEKSDEDDEKEGEEEKDMEKSDCKKSDESNIEPKTEEELKKSIADNISALKKLQGIEEPTAIEKSLKETNDKLEKSLSYMKEENEDLKKSLGETNDLIKSLEDKINEIGQNSQGTKHQIKFDHLEKGQESDLEKAQSEGKTIVSITDRNSFEKSLNDAWEGAEGNEKELLEKAVMNFSGSGKVAQDQDTLSRIVRAMAKQDIIVTK